MLYTEHLKSPLGFLKVQADGKYILSISFVSVSGTNKGNALSKKCVVQLKEYFAGQRKIFDLPVKLSGTPWQNLVWQKLAQIPYGHIISYKDLAIMVGNNNAARAIGGAVNKNKLPIIIPCHRVLGSSGVLTGYAGGINKKQYLLKLEKSFD